MGLSQVAVRLSDSTGSTTARVPPHAADVLVRYSGRRGSGLGVPGVYGCRIGGIKGLGLGFQGVWGLGFGGHKARRVSPWMPLLGLWFRV